MFFKLQQFEENVALSFNKHAPFKSKSVRTNNAPLMNKTLRKVIIIRSRLKLTFQEHPTAVIRDDLKKHQQRNLCINLKKEKLKFKGFNCEILDECQTIFTDKI